MSTEKQYRQNKQLNEKIEDLRIRLHHLVSTNPARLRCGEVYQLSIKLDKLIVSSQLITGLL